VSVWEEDEELEALPVIPAAGEAAQPPEKPRKLRRWQPPQRAGSVPRAAAGTARSAVVAEATGRASSPPEVGWREDLADGNRGRAASRLSQRSNTHNAGSGYGLA